MSDFQTETMPVARKQHTCCECNGSIQPGQKYQFISGCWDGDMDTFKTCTPCLEARAWATKQPEWVGDGEHLYSFGQLQEDLSYLALEIPIGDGRRFRAYKLQVMIACARQRG